MHILVTGGSGYLGGVTCATLLEAGHSLVSVDVRRPTWSPEVAGQPIRFVQADVLDLPAYRDSLDGVDAVIHLSAMSSDAACADSPGLVEQVNTLAPLRLARAALGAGVRRFVLASTCAVYGSGTDLDEDSSCRPLTPYGASKLRAEESLRGLVDDGLEPVLLRFGTLFGPAPTTRHDLVVNAMVRAAVTTGTVAVNGSGRQWRPLVHVADAAAALRWAAARPWRADVSVLNVAGPGANHRIGDLAQFVADRVPGAVVVRRPGEQVGGGYSVDASRIGRAWSHSWIPLAEGVRALRDGADEVGGAGPRIPVPSPPAEAASLPLAVPDITPADERAVVDVLRSGWLARGRHADEFEDRLREATGAEHVVAVSSCTAALHLSLLAAGVGPGDEVITTPVTWPATANVIEHVGAVPVFADVDPGTLNIDPGSVSRLVGPRTRAIVPVHMGGLPADLRALRAIADRCGAVLVEDAAHALGARHEGRPIGGGSPFVCFSFYATKSITTVDGGAVAMGDASAARTVRLLANHGMSSTAWSQTGGAATARPECLAPGYKYNVSDVAAALGVQQLERLPRFVDVRERLVQRYRRRLLDVPGISLPQTSGGHGGTRSAYHLMPVLVDRDGEAGVRRDRVARALRSAGITTGVHYRSLHLQPYYRDRYGLRPEDLPVATDLSDRLLSLPLHSRMTPADVDRVVARLSDALAGPQGLEAAARATVPA